MAALKHTHFPWLLYAYPWMPYPRRVILYLRQKGIPETKVKVVRVRDHVDGNEVMDGSYPPRPVGSLPILAIPIGDGAGSNDHTYIRQSLAIMHFLEELCNNNLQGFNIVEKARINEVLSLADECTALWNGVRLFGTQTSGFCIPEASKESVRWVSRTLAGVERFFQDRDMSLLRKGEQGHVTVADIALYQFLEFTKDCYGVDMTLGSGEKVKDVYGQDVIETPPKLVEFFEAFGTREGVSSIAEHGEVPPEYATKKMQAWADGGW